jgi:hypothetical protein
MLLEAALRADGSSGMVPGRRRQLRAHRTTADRALRRRASPAKAPAHR